MELESNETIEALIQYEIKQSPRQSNTSLITEPIDMKLKNHEELVDISELKQLLKQTQKNKKGKKSSKSKAKKAMSKKKSVIKKEKKDTNTSKLSKELVNQISKTFGKKIKRKFKFMPYKHQLNPSQRVLMGPGPSDVHPRVLNAMSMPLLGHLDPQFLEVMDDIKVMLKATLKTENELSFVVSAPGSAGMETCLVNLLEPGDDAVICVHGVFGNRMVDIAERCGATVTKVEAPWGEPINPADLQKVLNTKNPKLVAIVHAETSTGVLQPLEEISEMVHKNGALLVVDAVTSYCGVPLEVDKWGIDALYSGTQKCLSAPPGLSPVTFSPRAVRALENRKTKVQSWFLDLTMVKNYWAGSKRAYHHTAPVSSMYALREAYKLVLEEGLDNRFKRHRKNHKLLKAGLKDLGFKYLVDKPYRLPQLNAVKLPKHIKDEAALRRRLLNEYNIEVGGGLGDFAGKIWRIGLMGESCTANHVNMLLGALSDLID